MPRKVAAENDSSSDIHSYILESAYRNGLKNILTRIINTTVRMESYLFKQNDPVS